MGVLQRFERRLEGLVEGAFARAFGGAVEPVEVAAALQKEAHAGKAIVGHGRVLVPNSYAVSLAPADAERLEQYGPALREELARMLEDHAAEQGWSFVGPVEVSFAPAEDLAHGMPWSGRSGRRSRSAAGCPRRAAPGRPARTWSSCRAARSARSR